MDQKPLLKRTPGTLVAIAALSCLQANPFAHAQAPEVTDAAVPEPSAVDISQELELRRAHLEALQTELGVYDLRLAEAYSDLAGFYAEHDEPLQAAELYREALMVVRVNAGLYTDQQLPVLDSLISANEAAGLWEKVDDSRHLKFSIQSRLYSPVDDRYLAAVTDFGSWKLRLLRENLLQQNYRTLTREAEGLSDFYNTALARIDQSGRGNVPGLTPLLYGKSVTELELARYAAETPYQYFQGTVSQYISQTVCNNVQAPDGTVQRSCYTVQRENPRYRQSQQDAKRLAVLRSMRQVDTTLDRLQYILDANPAMAVEDRERLQRQVGELRVEYERVERVSRRGLFL